MTTTIRLLLSAALVAGVTFAASGKPLPALPGAPSHRLASTSAVKPDQVPAAFALAMAHFGPVPID